jgi:acyl carrier protein
MQVLGRVTAEDFVNCQASSDRVDISQKNLHDIQQAWLSGNLINWKAAYTGYKGQKIAVPAAPLLSQSYWVEEKKDQTEKSRVQDKQDGDIKLWLYQQLWRERIVAPDLDLKTLQPVIIFCAGMVPLISQLLEYFKREKIPCYLVTMGDEFKQLSRSHFQIDPQQISDYQQLENSLTELHGLPALCLVSLSFDKLSREQGAPQEILLNIVKQNKLIRHLKHLTTLVAGMNRLQCRDHHPEYSIITALTRGIGQEFPTIKTQLLDLDPDDSDQQCMQVVQSVLTSNLTDVSVWRDDKCWQYDYQVQPAKSVNTSYFKRRGVYLITGGLGDVASVHVDFLAAEFDAQLILVGRTPVPQATEWQAILDQESSNAKSHQKIKRLMQWQALGYSIHTEQADITMMDDMRALCQKTVAKFGRIDGVIHIAGAGSDMHYKILTDTDWAHCWKLISPKLDGIAVIAELARLFSIPDCLVISSISSALTGIGLSAYGATHNLLDAVVSKEYPHWRMMNWDAWSFYQHEQKQHGQLGAEIDKLAIKPQEGLQILKYAFSLPAWQQLFVSSANLSERHRYWAHRGFLEKSIPALNKSPRPTLHNEYVAPISRVQQSLADIWQSLLGIDRVGINDSFFELGGHSLLALELIHQLQTDFHHSCSVVDLFEAPTIAQLANKIDAADIQKPTVLETASDRVKLQLAARNAMHSIKTGTTHV